MLKKQTVWLLTMLSLMIVLSVYYMSSPTGEDLAYMNQETEENDQTTTTTDVAEESVNTEEEMGEATDAEGTMTGEEEVTSSITSDELFATIRMELEDERSKQLDRLGNIVASSTATTEEKNKAYDEMREIETVSTKENILEQTIKAENGYSDVLVRTVGSDVVVTVKADELSKTETVNIMQMVYDEFGEVNAEVKFQPAS